MASPANYWKLGLFVLCTLALLFAVLVWLGARRFDHDTFRMSTFFDEPVTGLSVGAPVSFRGMQIGQVREIRSAAERSRWIRVDADIDAEALFRIGLRRPETFDKNDPQIPPEVRARLERSLVTGSANIQTDYYDIKRHPVPAYEFEPPLNTIHSVPSPSTTFEAGLTAVLDRLPKVLDSTSRLLDKIDSDLEASDVPAMSQKLSELITSVNRAVDALDIQALDADADATLEQLRGMLSDAGEAARSIGALADSLRAGDGDLATALTGARALLDDLGRLVDGLDLDTPTRSATAAADEVTGLTRDLRDVVPDLRRTLQRLQGLVDLLERDPGALLHGRQAPTDPRRR